MAKLNLRASPPHRVLTALAFPDAFLAADAALQVLEHKPIGLEGFDHMLVDFMQRKHLAVSTMYRCSRPAADFCWWKWAPGTKMKRSTGTRMLVEASQSWPVRPQARVYNSADAARVWFVRENALGASRCLLPGASPRLGGLGRRRGAARETGRVSARH